jgi:RNA polymerase sigma-70 factor (ECF subfamily)
LEAVPPPDGFDRFYRAHAGTVRQALCLVLGEVDLGTEAADEAMARACERWPAVSAYANPTGWAYRVGLNWARSRQRRHRWRDRRPVPDVPVPTVPGDPDLTVALGRLGVDHRAVVVCRYLLDWSVDDTAAALDGSTVAVGNFYDSYGPVRVFDLATGAERTVDAHGVLP